MTQYDEWNALHASLKYKLLMLADLRGDADGLASCEDVHTLVSDWTRDSLPTYDWLALERLNVAEQLLEESRSQRSITLSSTLRQQSLSLRRLALEINGLWGTANGHIACVEIERVARFYLFAWPFFKAESAVLVELARVIDCFETLSQQPDSFLHRLHYALHSAPQELTTLELQARSWFDEALIHSEVPGSPEYMRDVENHSPKWHSLSILEHVAVAIRGVRALSDAIHFEWREGPATMLLHDVGKILTRQLRADGVHSTFTFWDHEPEGAAWLQQRGADSHLVFQVAHHAVLRELPFEELKELARHDAQCIAQMVIVYCADQLGKGNTPPQRQSFTLQYEKILALARYAEIDGIALIAHFEELRERWFGRPFCYLGW